MCILSYRIEFCTYSYTSSLRGLRIFIYIVSDRLKDELASVLLELKWRLEATGQSWKRLEEDAS